MRIKYPLFLRTYNSPFKPLKLKWYIGKTKIGVPLFYPRVWVKHTEKEILDLATIKFNDPQYAKNGLEYWIKNYRNCRKAVPKKVGFDFRDLFWKTKYDSYRFEFSPVWSFVFFGYQIAVIFIAPEAYHYWESFLFYHKDTDKSKSAKERIEQCKKEYPQTWTLHNAGHKEIINYYDLILKEKYR